MSEKQKLEEFLKRIDRKSSAVTLLYKKISGIGDSHGVWNHLERLNLRGNMLVNLCGIEQFVGLKDLDVSLNMLEDLKAVFPIQSLKNLDSIVLEGNPVAKLFNYKQIVFMLNCKIKFLDGKRYSQREREFFVEMLKFEARATEDLLKSDMKITLLRSFLSKLSIHQELIQSYLPFICSYNEKSLQTFQRIYRLQDYWDEGIKITRKKALLSYVNSIREKLSQSNLDLEKGFVEVSSAQCQEIFHLEKSIQVKLDYILERFKCRSFRGFLGEEQETYLGLKNRKMRYMSAINLPINMTANKIYNNLGFPLSKRDVFESKPSVLELSTNVNIGMFNLVTSPFNTSPQAEYPSARMLSTPKSKIKEIFIEKSPSDVLKKIRSCIDEKYPGKSKTSSKKGKTKSVALSESDTERLRKMRQPIYQEFFLKKDKQSEMNKKQEDEARRFHAKRVLVKCFARLKNFCCNERNLKVLCSSQIKWQCLVAWKKVASMERALRGFRFKKQRSRKALIFLILQDHKNASLEKKFKKARAEEFYFKLVTTKYFYLFRRFYNERAYKAKTIVKEARRLLSLNKMKACFEKFRELVLAKDLERGDDSSDTSLMVLSESNRATQAKAKEDEKLKKWVLSQKQLILRFMKSKRSFQLKKAMFQALKTDFAATARQRKSIRTLFVRKTLKRWRTEASKIERSLPQKSLAKKLAGLAKIISITQSRETNKFLKRDAWNIWKSLPASRLLLINRPYPQELIGLVKSARMNNVICLLRNKFRAELVVEYFGRRRLDLLKRRIFTALKGLSKDVRRGVRAPPSQAQDRALMNKDLNLKGNVSPKYREKEEFMKNIEERVTKWSSNKSGRSRGKNLSFNEYQRIKEEQKSKPSLILNPVEPDALSDQPQRNSFGGMIDIMSPNFLSEFFDKYSSFGKENPEK